MALTFPLSLAGFMDRLRGAEVELDPIVQNASKSQGGSEFYSVEVADPIWEGRVSLPPMKPRAAAEIEALLDVLSVPGRAFMASRKNRTGTAADIGGVALGAAIVTLSAVDPINHQVAFSGLPAGFEFTAGDTFSFVYASGAVALHKLVENGVANGAGVSPQMDVFPPLIDGPNSVLVTGLQVELVRPYCKAKLISRSYGVDAGGVVSGLEFSFRQSFK